MSGFDVFRPLYDALSGMGCYKLSPEAIRDLLSPDPGELLIRDGSNLPSVLSNVDGSRKTAVEQYLAVMIPGGTGVEARTVGSKLTLDFHQELRRAKHPSRFPANNVSDGTLRALGVLVALFQSNGPAMRRRRLVGIEEPEIALHPAAAGVLIDSLSDAAQRAQVIVTTHSADLLDNDTIPDSSILAVLSEYGETRIGPVDEAGHAALRDHLFTAGELLRMDQLRPDPDRLAPRQLDLFFHTAKFRSPYRQGNWGKQSGLSVGGTQPINV